MNEKSQKIDIRDTFVPPNTTVLVRGGGDLASGTAWRLHRCGFNVLITEIDHPLAVRRTVCFCEAVFEGRVIIEGVAAALADSPARASELWEKREIPVFVDPLCEIKRSISPHVLVDGIMAKKNLGTSLSDAPLVIGLGPGFTAGKDVHNVIETNRGHFLGRMIDSGCAEPDTGTPGAVMGITRDRVIHAPRAGLWKTSKEIGAMLRAGDKIGTIDGYSVTTLIDGVLRGAVRAGINVGKGMKLGDVDPRGIREHCFTISDKALAISGGVLEAIFHHFGRKNQ
jgi:xanthine dehydrogenase accessory factor